MTTPEQKLRYQYLAALTLLGDVAHRLPAAVQQEIAQAMRNAMDLVPGLKVGREKKRYRIEWHKVPPPDRQGAWQKLIRSTPIDHTPEQRAELVAHCQRVMPSMSAEAIERQLGIVDSQEVWLNDLYQVHVHRDVEWMDGFPPLIHLSIRRLDREAVRDWRHFQRIKNQLVGPECEGVELYPAESRLMDSANQFHVWCISEPGVKFPVGFDAGRLVDYTESVAGSRQRPDLPQEE